MCGGRVDDADWSEADGGRVDLTSRAKGPAGEGNLREGEMKHSARETLTTAGYGGCSGRVVLIVVPTIIP